MRACLPCVTFAVTPLVCLSGPTPPLCPSKHHHKLSTPLTFSSFFPLLWLSFNHHPQWCERNEQCRRLQLRDLLVAPLQRLTRYPLLLRNIAKRCQTEEEVRGLQAVAEQVDTSICERINTIHPFSAAAPSCCQGHWGLLQPSSGRVTGHDRFIAGPHKYI